MSEITDIKVWWKDITLWTNVISVLVLILNNQFGYAISPELQAGILAIINIILRAPNMATTQAQAKTRSLKARDAIRSSTT